MKAIICAAGEGSRLGLGMPKCLVEVGGKKIIDWQLEALENFQIYIVVGFQAEKVINYLKDKNCHIIINNEWQTTTTAHSISLVGLTENCLILDGDLVFTKDQISNLHFNYEWIGITERKTQYPVLVNKNSRQELVKFNVTDSPYEWACICYNNPSYFSSYENRFVYQVLESVPGIIKMTQYIENLYEVDSMQDLQNTEEWARTL